MVEITINAKQAIAMIWTLVAFGLSLAVALLVDNSIPWYMLMAIFFGLMLVITLPVYLLLALWQITSKSENA
jgi:hypothetical protein